MGSRAAGPRAQTRVNPIPKKKRRPSRKNLKRVADQGFAAYIRSRGVCQAAGLDQVRCNGMLQCAHIEGRGFHALRWDEMNALALCGGHHSYYTNRPFFWTMFIAEHFPEQHEYVTAHIRDVWDHDLEAVAARWSVKR